MSQHVRTRVLIALIACGSLLFILGLDILQEFGREEAMWYWYDGERIDLKPIDGEWIVGLKHGEETDFSNVAQSLHQESISIRSTLKSHRLIFTEQTKPTREQISNILDATNVISFRPRYQGSQRTSSLFVPDEIYVVFDRKIGLDDAREFGSPYNLSPDLTFNNFPKRSVLFFWNGSRTQHLAEVMDVIRRIDGIIAVEPNLGNNIVICRSDSLTSNDPAWDDSENDFFQWNLLAAELPEAWKLYDTLEESLHTVGVAVLDAYVDSDHPELSGRTSVTRNISYLSGEEEHNYDHGSQVATILVANTNNNSRIAGVAGSFNNYYTSKVELYLAEIVAHGGTSNFTSYAEQAIRWAASEGADILNCSWILTEASSAVDQAIWDVTHDDGRDGLGCIIVFGSGNSGGTPIREPGDHANALSVGAVDYNGVRWTFSQYDSLNNRLDLVAPSGYWPIGPMPDSALYKGEIPASGYDPGGQGAAKYPVVHFNGTSGAAPLVAGVAALVMSVEPDLYGSQIMDILKDTARKIGGGDRYHDPGVNPTSYGEQYSYNGAGYNRFVGYGQVNAYQALLEVQLYPGKVTGLTLHTPSTECSPPSECSTIEDWELRMGARVAAPPSGEYCMKISWNDPSAETEERFQIERSEDGESFYVQYLQTLQPQAPDTTCFYDKGLAAGSTYWYRVAEVDADGRIGIRSDVESKTMPDGEGDPDSWVANTSAITFGFDRAWPNPFNSQIVIRFGLREAAEDVSLNVFNIRGQEVKRIFLHNLPPGFHEYRWDGTDQTGRGVSTGVYLVLLRAGMNRDTIKIALVR